MTGGESRVAGRGDAYFPSPASARSVVAVMSQCLDKSIGSSSPTFNVHRSRHDALIVYLCRWRGTTSQIAMVIASPDGQLQAAAGGMEWCVRFLGLGTLGQTLSLSNLQAKLENLDLSYAPLTAKHGHGDTEYDVNLKLSQVMAQEPHRRMSRVITPSPQGWGRVKQRRTLPHLVRVRGSSWWPRAMAARGLAQTSAHHEIKVSVGCGRAIK